MCRWMSYDPSRLSETAELLRALGSPVRLAIVLELEREPRCVHHLVERLGVSQPVASQHLRVLRGLRLVRGDRRGREVVYALSDSHAAKLARDAIEHIIEGDPG